MTLNNNVKAFLDMIAVSEGTSSYPEKGYKTIVGGAQFDRYDDHPHKLVHIPRIKNYSSAAGRYQILGRYYDAYKKQLRLPDFSPDSQDAIAIQMIKECRAYDDVVNGKFAVAVDKCRSRWASFPGAGYGQHENKLDKLQAAYIKAGGTLLA